MFQFSTISGLSKSPALIISLALSMLLFSSHSTANELVIGDESSAYIPTEQDFRRLNKAKEYLKAKTSFVKAQQALQKAREEGSKGSSSNLGHDSTSGRLGNSGVPRSMRGTEQGDFYLDAKGNRVQMEKSPQAYISSISGQPGNLTAEVSWGNNLLTVAKGDPMVGGDWVVEAVNTNDLVLHNRTSGKRVRLGVVPVDIKSILK